MDNLILCHRSFVNRINEISKFIEMNSIMGKNVSSFNTKDFTIEQKAFFEYLTSLNNSIISYNAIIISLYGCFENYIDDILNRYIENIFHHYTSYEDLPAGLKDKYRKNLGQFLSDPQRFVNMDLQISEVIKNYSSILDSDFNKTINSNFLLKHPGNLKIKQIQTLFNELNIKDLENKIKNSNIFKNYFIHTLEMEYSDFRLKKSKDTSDLFSNLDFLVDQRNNVSHSWVNENRISLPEIKDKIIPFLTSLSEICLRILLIELFQVIDGNNYSFIRTKPLGVFYKNIVCIKNTGINIKIHDYIIYKTEDIIKCSKILNIQINRKNVDKTGTKLQTVCLELDENITIESDICYFCSY